MSEPGGLPVCAVRGELLAAIAAHQVLLCVGETGSGKTTQIPQFLLAAGYGARGMIAVTQPRRVAAVAVARRVAEEMGVRLGSTVGYAVRFESELSRDTRIKFMTDGTFVHEFLSDSAADAYSVIMLDEAHERSIHTDVLFGLVKRALAQRPALRVVITSATLDTDKLSAFFGRCPAFHVPGRLFPVDLYFSKAGLPGLRTAPPDHAGAGSSDAALAVPAMQHGGDGYVAEAVDAVRRIQASETEAGDVLVFLAGQADIESASRMLAAGPAPPAAAWPLLVVPLYGALSSEAQHQIFRPPPPGMRKVVLATNIAETSLTVPGVRFVVDSGFHKEKAYDPRTGMESLLLTPISRTSAAQRAGRAGRTAPGKCYRLYSRAQHAAMAADAVPEIQRSNLANTVLYLKVLGVRDVFAFDFLDPPSRHALSDALRQLFLLGAVDADGAVTALGTAMARLPLEPSLSRMLIAADSLGVREDAVTLAALMSAESVFYRAAPRPAEDGPFPEVRSAEFHHALGDHATLMRVHRAWALAGGGAAGQAAAADDWCRAHGVNARAMRTCSKVRTQLLDILAAADAGASRGAAAAAGATASRAVVADGETDQWRALRQAVCQGFFPHTARAVPAGGGGFRLAGDDAFAVAYVHPSSCLAELLSPPRGAPAAASTPPKSHEWLIYQDLVHSSSRVYMRNCVAVDSIWLADLLPRIRSVNVRRLCGLPPVVAGESQPAPTPGGPAKDPGTGAAGVGGLSSAAAGATGAAAARERFLGEARERALSRKRARDEQQ